MANDLKPYQASIEYAKNIGDDCTLTDGYICAEINHDDFSGHNNAQIMLPGAYIPAFIVCYEHFKGIKDLSDDQKNLKHYKIRFTEDNENFIIQFGGLLLPDIKNGKPDGIILAVYGRTTKYWVNKKTLKITKHVFSK